jgi:hypothetical protein
MSRLIVVALIAVGALLSCDRNPAGPSAGPLATGRWSSDRACLSVTDSGCNLAVGCGHGQFPRPTIRTDGTFDIDGTYRIEAGPISIDPAPPAHFSGIVTGSGLALTVTPTGTLPVASYSLTPTTAGTCPIPCL